MKLLNQQQAQICENSIGEYKKSYALKNIKARTMWNKGYTGKGVKIAILDTGCDVNHDELKDKIIGGYNFTHNDDYNPEVYNDYNGHGTHVAGIISSVAKDSQLLILKVLDEKGNGGYNEIVNAINYAIDQNVDIISLSLGGYIDDSTLYSAVIRAINNHILVVCASGNDGDGDFNTEEKIYPGAYNEVIQVGAMDENYSITDFSNSNKEVDLIAPGKDIVSTFPGNKYATLSGTSQATPFVSGALALLKQYCREDFERELREDELYAQLIKRTKTLKGVHRTQQGNGFLSLSI